MGVRVVHSHVTYQSEERQRRLIFFNGDENERLQFVLQLKQGTAIIRIKLSVSNKT